MWNAKDALHDYRMKNDADYAQEQQKLEAEAAAKNAEQQLAQERVAYQKSFHHRMNRAATLKDIHA